MLLAMLRETDCVGTRLLYTMGVNIQKLYAAVLGAMGYDNEAIQEEFQAAKAMQNLGGSPTPALDQYSRDLTQMAAEANWTCCGKRKGNQQANPDFKPQNQE